MSKTDFVQQIVKNQLNAMNCDRYKIGIFDRSSTSMSMYFKEISFDGIIRLIPRMKYENFNGKDIFIGQSEGIDRALILVDDLTSSQINKMRIRGVNPACVLETSPSNYQVWVSLGSEPMPKRQRKLVAVSFANEFGGDKASTSANHLGRLAGFTNRKPEYLTPNGFPFVRCLNHSGIHAQKSAEIRAWALAKDYKEEEEANKKKLSICSDSLVKTRKKLDPGQAFVKYYKQWTIYVKFIGKDLDLSRGDFAVASRMLKENYSKQDIMQAIIDHSPNIEIRKPKHIGDYAFRTVMAAENNLLI
ncbi:MAG: RepB family DNA primase [Clostridiales Family XIII bacterium]|jgi:hypothetical protein|nr:RepB family DNA primase [Clostridiales Family XIII bacterium]